MTDYFENALKELDIEITQPEGLVFTDRSPVDYHEYIAIEHARRYKATAVYFRRFGDGRPPVPQIYIYDYTSDEKNNEEIACLHRELWNAGQVPLFFIFTRTEIKIFNCLKKPFDKGQFKSSPFEIIKLASDVEKELNKKKEFSSRNFDNGSFWESSIYKDHFKIEDSAYETLLRQLNNTKAQIIKLKVLPEAIAKRLLVMAILIKYLEERKDEAGNTVFPKDFFSKFSQGAKNFSDILRERGACVRLFDELSSHFNGEIFKLKETEKENLIDTDLNLFASFLEGSEGSQGNFWPLYSFNDLPIELISNIYENFLGDIKGVVYTPPYLVNFLIDEAMPLDKPKTDFKVLDPACGSGIFLVAAYRRLIYWWRIQHEWKKPDLKILKKILRENIYGIDIEIEAIQLALFSISLALCDELSPKVIWEELKFDNLLEKNFFPTDFFELVDKKSIEKKFDLVIGNPPFISKLTTHSAKRIEREMQKFRVKLPDQQIALLFLEQAMKLCKKEALICLLLPATSFIYNKNSYDFRKYFLEKYNAIQILDFTCLRNVLFENAAFPIIGLFVKNEEPIYQDILHITIRRTKASKEKIYFDLDHYDFYLVSYKEAIENKYIWICNLLAGGRLKYIIKRMSSLQMFREYLQEKIKKCGWVVGEGYTVGNRQEIDYLKELEKRKKNLTQEESNKLIKLQKKYKKADYLTGKRNLPTEAFTKNGIDESKINILNDEYFDRIRKEEIFKGPHLLIKEHPTLPVEFVSQDLSFKHQIIGIHTPENQNNELNKISKRFKNKKIYSFYLAISGTTLVGRIGAINKDDIDNLPYPEDEKELELSRIENIVIDDVLEYMTDFCKHGEKSKILQKTSILQLEHFGEVYCEVLNSVYKEFKPCNPLVTPSFICFPFYYGEKPSILKQNQYDMEIYLNKLIFKRESKSLRIVRILRIYEENVIYLIKPDQIRYWMKSIAVRDADETFSDLVKQGY